MNLTKLLDDKMETVLITLPSPMMPLDLIDELEKYLGVPESIIYFTAYFENKYMITIYGNEALNKLKSRKRVVIGKKKYTYTVCEDRVMRVAVEKTSRSLKTNDLDIYMRQYGRVLMSQLSEHPKKNIYYALMDLKRSVPDKVQIKRQYYEVKIF